MVSRRSEQYDTHSVAVALADPVAYPAPTSSPRQASLEPDQHLVLRFSSGFQMCQDRRPIWCIVGNFFSDFGGADGVGMRLFAETAYS